MAALLTSVVQRIRPISITRRASNASRASLSEGSITYQPRRLLTVTMPRAASRVRASRTMVRLQSNTMASCCSPRRAPGASFWAMMASMMRVLMSDALAIVHPDQQIPCHWYTSNVHHGGDLTACPR